ncbi:UbiD-domain-containing protein [Periconia macrospinosa]|uniref:Ferulic acid decarboxylase 1 n=1 Tax=Periconia macrospinosa TaxID=97972 RepID=A0A2V1E1G3_9PLEO|nr:UbiD-domain-containing protein [Periconia macrospinosa]
MAGTRHFHQSHLVAQAAKEQKENSPRDFRAFLETLRQDNDLVEINTEVDPDLEVGAIVRKVSETDGKAPLLNNVKGARDGLWRIFGNAAGLRKDGAERYGRIARNLGLPKDATWKEICEKTQTGKNMAPIPPNIVPTGPCQQNIILGDDIDLEKLPVPRLHQQDGGRYLQTYGVHMLQTPDGSWTNWSIFRAMVHDKRHLVALVNPGQHNHMVRGMWRKLGKDVPWALALGVPPAATLAAAMPLPKGVSEGEYVGAMLGKPLDLVKCHLNDLLVPANSEIILEGTMSNTETGPEGPFGDYLGYVFDDEQRPGPLFKVDAITHRNDAILPVSVPGRITDESHTTAALAAPELLTICKEHNLPINNAYAPLETMATWCVLQVNIKKLGELNTNPNDFCKKVGDILFSTKSTMLMNKLLLVGDDIDIYKFADVIWALSTRCRPGQDDFVFDDIPGFPLTPYMAQGFGHPTRGGKVVSNCLLPVEYKGERSWSTVDFENSYPQHVKDRVLALWESTSIGS